MAESHGSAQVIASHLPAGASDRGEPTLDQVTGRLSHHERLIYELARQRQPIMSTQLRQDYAERCRREGLEPVARRTFSKYVRGMIDMGLAQSDQRSIGEKGRLIRVTAG